MTTGLPEPTARTRLAPDIRRRQILTAARDVFLESGYVGATIKEIARASGLTGTSVYAHFSSKEEIYRHAVEEPLHHLVTALQDQMHKMAERPGANRQAVLGRANEVFLAAMAEIAPLLAVAIVARPEQSRDFYTRTVWPQLHQAIDAVLDVVFPHTQVDADIATLGFLGVHYSVVMSSVLLEAPLDVPQAAAQITALFTRSIHPDAPVAHPAPVRAKRRERMSAPDRRRMIVAAARETFLEKGLTATRMKDVAVRAGLTEPGLYAHFASKDELYQAAVHDPLERLTSRFAAATIDLAGQADIERQVLHQRVNRQLLDFLVELAPLLTVALFSEMESGRRYYQQVFLPRLEEATLAVVTRIYGPHAERRELESIVEAMVSMNLGLALDSILRGRLVELRDAPARVMQLGPEDPRPDAPMPQALVGSHPDKPAGGVSQRSRLPATERRQMILEAAREVFREFSSSGASIREVAKRAGVSEPVVYQHFGSREGLFRTAVEDHLAGLFELAAARAEGILADVDLDRYTRLRALDEVYLQLMIDTAPLSAVSFFEAAGRGKALYQNTVREVMVRTANPLHELLTGAPLPLGAEEVPMMSLFGIHFGVALDGMLRGTVVDVERMAARITEVYR